jgi:hypothetical protein
MGYHQISLIADLQADRTGAEHPVVVPESPVRCNFCFHIEETLLGTLSTRQVDSSDMPRFAPHTCSAFP